MTSRRNVIIIGIDHKKLHKNDISLKEKAMEFFANGSAKSNQEAVTLDMLQKKPMPEHIAIIMDGNGRWAKRRGLPRIAGHRVGMESLEKVIECFDELSIRYLTVYAFSTENWKRPAEEVNALMDLMVEFIDKKIDYLDQKGVRVNPIGVVEKIKGETFERIMYAKERTQNNDHLIFNVALNYGGRQELVQGIQAICRRVQSGELAVEDIDEAVVGESLYTAGQPDPDLLIRPSGELRVSNFLLWQIAYSEFWTTDVLWPDFRKEDLWRAIYDFQNRQRRFGGLQA